MSKEENTKFLKIQTCVLKVNIHCDGCKKKVKKLLHKIDGVYTTSIDAEQGKVTVSGNVDPAALIKKLCKAGKHAELWAPKGGHNLSNQFQKLQLESGKGQQQDRGKAQKGGGGGGGGGKDQKNQQPPPNQQQLLQQMKEFQDLKLRQVKDLKFPFQDFKSVKFSSPPEGCDDGSDYDDEFDDDYDDEEFDDMDGFDDDFDEDLKPIKMKPMNPPYNGNGMMNDKKGFGGGGANGKKSGTAAAVDIPVQIKGMGGNNNAKNVDSKGKKGGGGGSGNQNQGGGKNGGRAQDGKKGDNGNKGAKNASGGNNNNTNRGNVGSKTEGGTSAVGGGQTMPNPNVPNMMLGQGFPAMGMGQMGNIQAPMGNIPAPRGAVQGLPAGGPPPGYFQGGVVPPEMRAVANPYQQQYMAALMQQQRMMNGFDRPYQAMGYARPPPPHVSYMPPPPPPGEPYTHLFSDENTNSCSIT